MIEPVSQAWLDYIENRDNVLVIWRPHPYLTEQLWLKKEIEKTNRMKR